MIIKYLFLFSLLLSCSHKSWRDSSRESVGIAPKASELKEDIVQIYYARAYGWRGNFGVHPWISWKELKDEQYTVAQVTSWNLRRSGTTVSVMKDLPDRKWFDNDPVILLELRGKSASRAIGQIKKAIETYPHKDLYRVWPGPNSNTFVTHIIRNVDEFNLELPPHAVGKDYLGGFKVLALTPSSTGLQFSLFGLLGFSLGLAEGVELNLLGMSFGIDFWTPALKLPFVGRLGLDDQPLVKKD